MTTTPIMVQPPAATDLWQIADLWAAMHAELAPAVTPTDPEPTDPAPTDPAPTSPASDPAPTDPAATGAPSAAQKSAYEEQLRAWYRDPAVFMLVGVRPMGDEHAGQIVAFMIARAEDGRRRYGRLLDLYVRPSLRGNNLARHMVEAAAGWLRAQRCEFLEADVLVRNRSGMAFLASTDFQLYSSVLRKKL